MSVTIGTGDTGKTSLFGGTRVPKNDARIEVVGTLDELQSIMGKLLSLPLTKESEQILSAIMHMIFDISGEIASEGKFVAENVTPQEADKMTRWIDILEAKMPKLTEFMLPRGVEEAQWMNLARAVTRRAERRVFVLFDKKQVRPTIFQFLNRFSRLLFTLERWENFQKKGKEYVWKKGIRIPEANEDS